MVYRQAIDATSYVFDDLRDLLAKATPPRSGDRLAGIAADSAEQMIAARMALADVPLQQFLNETVVPYEDDEVTRLIVDGHDAAAFAVVHLPIALLAASIGVWLFYVQHQFEHTSWDHAAAWVRHEAALHGSSHYDLPGILRWLTANIGLHHVHHLSSRIPYYRLPRVLRENPSLNDVNRLSLMQSFYCVRLVLWDEKRRRLITFRDARRSSR